MEQDVAAEQIASQNQRRLLDHLPGSVLPLLVSVTKSLSMSLSHGLTDSLREGIQKKWSFFMTFAIREAIV